MLKRIPVILILAALVTFPLLAQAPKRPRLEGAPNKALEAVQKALNLNDTQVAGLRALIDARRQETQAAAQESREKGQVVRNLLQQPNPNPTDVGTAILALRGTRERLQGIQERFQTSFKALLSPDQLQIFEAMQNAGANIGPFRALGLLRGLGAASPGLRQGKLAPGLGIGKRR